MSKNSRMIVDTQGELAGYICDPERTIPKAHVKAVCKKGEGLSQCRYLGSTATKIGDKIIPVCVCAKLTPLKWKIDEVVSGCTGGSRGDNCPGLGEIKSDKPKK